MNIIGGNTHLLVILKKGILSLLFHVKVALYSLWC